MIKIMSVIGTIVAVYWARFVLSAGWEQTHNGDAFFEGMLLVSFLWVCVVGSVIAWKLLLVMVRQLGSAMRGK